MSTKKLTSKNSPSLIHEKNAAGQHRIIRIADGVSVAGDWAEHHSLAILGSLRASYSSNAFVPEGIFTISERVYTRLS
jgi:hypothetical protein